jgi:beta-glucosidase-like glycosyl hydrolase
MIKSMLPRMANPTVLAIGKHFPFYSCQRKNRNVNNQDDDFTKAALLLIFDAERNTSSSISDCVNVRIDFLTPR